jgi:hypothetical protein
MQLAGWREGEQIGLEAIRGRGGEARLPYQRRQDHMEHDVSGEVADHRRPLPDNQLPQPNSPKTRLRIKRASIKNQPPT